MRLLDLLCSDTSNVFINRLLRLIQIHITCTSRWSHLVAVLVREMEVVVVGVTKKKTKSNQMQKRSGGTSINVLRLVPPMEFSLLVLAQKSLWYLLYLLDKTNTSLDRRSLTTGKSLVERNNVHHSLGIGGSTEVLIRMLEIKHEKSQCRDLSELICTSSNY